MIFIGREETILAHSPQHDNSLVILSEVVLINVSINPYTNGGTAMFSKFHKNQKGFTLIELMIVVVIIGILAALAIPRFMQSTAKGKQSSASYILTQIANAEREHHKEHGIYLDVGNTAKPGEQFGLLGVKIPADCPYTFTIDETPTGGLLFTAEGNIDNDAVVDIWTKDLTNNNPVNTQNDVTLR